MSGIPAAVVFAVVMLAVVAVSRGRAGFHVAVWRWLSGLPSSGEEVTDAGWIRPGSKAFTRTGHARRWWFRPRRHRAMVRTAGSVVAAIVAWGLLFHLAATLVVVCAAWLAGCGYGVWVCARWLRSYRHRRQWVKPLHLVAAPLVGHPVATDPAAWLTVARDRRRVVVLPPPTWKGTAEERARLVDVVATRLALDTPEVRWALQGPKPRLELVQSVPPPPRVSLADAMPAIEAARPDELVWGLGRRSVVVKTSLSGDSPHVGLSMGSGAGKSMMARSLLAQQLRRGAVGVIVDVKMISHQWASSLPNVVIFRRPAEIHDAMVWLAGEVSRRNEVALAGADADGEVHADVGPRIVVVLEELNATIAQLRAYWLQVRTACDPKRSPALDALDLASFTGRQALVNLVYIGQRLSDKATGGGGDARENIGVIAFGRWRAATWKMLAPDFPMPAKSLAPGRVQVVSDVVRETQGVFMTAAQARELALSGQVSPLPSSVPGLSRRSCDIPETDSGRTPSDLRFVGDGEVNEPVHVAVATLREAVEAGLVPLSLAAARKRAERDPSFPRAVGRAGTAATYPLDDLAEWVRGRRG